MRDYGKDTREQWRLAEEKITELLGKLATADTAVDGLRNENQVLLGLAEFLAGHCINPHTDDKAIIAKRLAWAERQVRGGNV